MYTPKCLFALHRPIALWCWDMAIGKEIQTRFVKGICRGQPGPLPVRLPKHGDKTYCFCLSYQNLAACFLVSE
jgi:hypothetical protein